MLQTSICEVPFLFCGGVACPFLLYMSEAVKLNVQPKTHTHALCDGLTLRIIPKVHACAWCVGRFGAPEVNGVRDTGGGGRGGVALSWGGGGAGVRGEGVGVGGRGVVHLDGGQPASV